MQNGGKLYNNHSYPNGTSKYDTNEQQTITANQRSQHFLSYAMPMSSNMPITQSLMYNTQNAYNLMYGTQSMYSNQNTFPATFNTYNSQMDWLPDASKQKVQKPVHEKQPAEKLSPHSCCGSQIDTLGMGICSPLSDSFKTGINSDLSGYKARGNMIDPQWYYGSNYNGQKYNDLPSCSHVGQIDNVDLLGSNASPCCRDVNTYPDQSKTFINSVKYCSIQRPPDLEPIKNWKGHMYPNNKFNESYDANGYSSCQVDNRMSLEQCGDILRMQSCLHDIGPPPGECTMPPVAAPNVDFFPTNDINCLELYEPDALKRDSKPESQCGGESDIIVEDSEEEESSSDVSEDCDIDTSTVYVCVVCNLTSTTSGEIIYFRIGDETLLTSTTQTAVVTKLKDVTGQVFPKTITDHICTLCLNLVNTIDCLEFKLNSTRKQLMEISEKCYSTLVENVNSVLENSCENEISVVDNPPPLIEAENKENSISDYEIRADLNQNKRICKICNKYFCQSDIHKHKQLHASHIHFKCALCHRSFTMKRLLDNHMKRHNGHRDFLCDKCGKTYIKRHSLELHVRRHENAFRYFCDVCKKGFVSNTSLEIHRRSHSDVKPFTCEICARKFRTNTNLQEHVRFCSGDMPFACDQCEKKFAAASKLNDHIKLKHEKKFKVTCTDCGMGFTKVSEHKAHVASHSNDRPHDCTKCGKCYKTLGNLNHHMKLHDELPYKCEVCDKAFQRKENLVAHQNSHAGLKPFDCTLCEKTFGMQKHLDAHLRIHNGTMPKKTCPVCGKLLSHSLAEHMRLHSGVKPFKCDTCLLDFTSNGALRKHRKRKHPQS